MSFKIIDSEQPATDENGNYTFINIEILDEFISNEIDENIIEIDSRGFFGTPLGEFTENSEWLTVILKGENKYYVSLCAPRLIKENQYLIGDTGLDVLDNSENLVTVNDFRIAINAHRQGLSQADRVCQSNNSFCTKVKTTYNITTGELILPSIEYKMFGFRMYSKAKLKKQSNNPLTFIATEVE